MKDKKTLARIRRKKGIRKKVFGTSEKPRISVFRSARHIYVQAIDDNEGKTLLSLSTVSPEVRKEISYGGNIKAAEVTGKILNDKLKEKGINQVVFDRNGYLFHGRVRAMANKMIINTKEI